MEHCKNCTHTFEGNFCNHCGQAKKLKRIDSQYINHEIQHLLHVEKGIFFTAKELLLRPGFRIKEFISENRNKLMKPIPFLIISSLIYSFISQFFHIEDYYIENMKTSNAMLENSTYMKMLQWIQKNYGYSNLLMSGFIAFFIRLFFKKQGFNFFEISILLCFIIGESMLFYVVFALLEGISQYSLILIFTVLFFLYYLFAIGQFFEGKAISKYFKGFFAYLLGSLAFYIFIAIIGITYDLIFKK